MSSSWKQFRKMQGFSKKKTPKVAPVVARYVKRQIDNNTENKLKVVALPTNFSSITNAWSELQLLGVQQGVAKTQRIGNRIKVRSIEVKGVLSQGSNEAVTDDAWNVVRIVLGQYSGSSGTPLATAGVVMNDPIRIDYGGARGLLRKKYLDKYIPLVVQSTEQGAGDGYAPQVKGFKYYKKFKSPIIVNYSDDTANYPDKGFVLSMLSDSIALTNPGFVAGFVLITYEDA